MKALAIRAAADAYATSTKKNKIDDDDDDDDDARTKENIDSETTIVPATTKQKALKSRLSSFELLQTLAMAVSTKMKLIKDPNDNGSTVPLLSFRKPQIR